MRIRAGVVWTQSGLCVLALFLACSASHGTFDRGAADSTCERTWRARAQILRWCVPSGAPKGSPHAMLDTRGSSKIRLLRIKGAGPENSPWRPAAGDASEDFDDLAWPSTRADSRADESQQEAVLGRAGAWGAQTELDILSNTTFAYRELALRRRREAEKRERPGAHEDEEQVARRKREATTRAGLSAPMAAGHTRADDASCELERESGESAGSAWSLDRSRAVASLRGCACPTPQTPKPHIPIPLTLKPHISKSQTLKPHTPNPQTLNLQIPNPKPQNLTPQTLTPQTLNPQPQTPHAQPQPPNPTPQRPNPNQNPKP